MKHAIHTMRDIAAKTSFSVFSVWRWDNEPRARRGGRLDREVRAAIVQLSQEKIEHQAEATRRDGLTRLGADICTEVLK